MKKIIFSILLFALLIPKFQQIFSVFTLDPLSGTINTFEQPNFTFREWLDGSFQSRYEKCLDEKFGLRNFFIRFYNQIDFSAFNKTHSEVTVGKNGFLFQDGYLNEIIGWDLVADDVMKRNIENIRKAEEYFNERKIFLMTIIAPGKADYYKE